MKKTVILSTLAAVALTFSASVAAAGAVTDCVNASSTYEGKRDCFYGGAGGAANSGNQRVLRNKHYDALARAAGIDPNTRDNFNQ